jgi:hypothetical protein
MKAERAVDTGQIIEFDAMDGLGWIQLDDGRRVRFSLTACGYLRPALGLRVRVMGLHEGYGGQLRASFLEEQGPEGI